ncbi:MAG: hypothetical protein ABIH23_18040 [bacterium]
MGRFPLIPEKLRAVCISLTTLFLLGTSGSLPAAENEKEPFIGDQSDGSRAVPVHLIPLLDEEGQEISCDDDPVLPFSSRQTCARECHNYETIRNGWHFNANDPSVPPGRPGHPWIFIDPKTGTQIPLSYRAWPGAYTPADLGLTSRDFIKRFGRHFPGGGIGEEESDDPDAIIRALVTGKLEINCLACHDVDPAHNQPEFAKQIARENFRWAAASTSRFTLVRGSAKDMPDTFDYMMPDPPKDPKKIPPNVTYRSEAFDAEGRVFFNIRRKRPSERCFFCHSVAAVGEHSAERWVTDEDVHLSAGLLCVDCHRNGIDHYISRGSETETNSPFSSREKFFSCEGCHLGNQPSLTPDSGRMTAPVPQHKGIPQQHFEKLTCTTCHSGPWPQPKTGFIKTSLAHGLGTFNVDKSPNALPRIISPVFAKTSEGKIAPHHLFWPSFWGTLENEEIRPLPLEFLGKLIETIISSDSSSGPETYLSLDDKHITEILRGLDSNNSFEGKPVYVRAGEILLLDAPDELKSMKHKAASPYLWPLAHDVRPAAQSLGVRGCKDCHSEKSGVFFGKVEVDSPYASVPESAVPMLEFLEANPTYVKFLDFVFKFRLLYKILILSSAFILAFVLFVYASRAIVRISDRFSEKEPPR